LSHFLPPTTTKPEIIHFSDTQAPEAQRYPKPKIETLQTELRKLLRVKATPKGKIPLVQPVKFSEFQITPVSGNWLIVSIKFFRDLVLYRVIFLLHDDKEADRIRQCSTCGKFFFRVRRQVHCSPQCADRANYQKRG